MPVSNALIEKRNKFTAKQKELAEVFDLAGPDRDFSKKDILEKLGAADLEDVAIKVKQRNDELAGLNEELQRAEFEQVEQDMKDREAARNVPVRRLSHPGAPTDTRVKSLGQRVIESKGYAEDFRKGQLRNVGVTVTLEDVDIKTLFQTTAGFAPESVRSGLLVEGVTRPIQVLDLIPTRPITQANDVYMEETTRTQAAAEKAEGVTYAESTYVWVQRTNPVAKITDSIPVTDEQLEDAPEVAGILDMRTRFGLRQRLDQQVVIGNGTPPNLRGILNVVGILTQPKGADPVFDAIFKALTQVRVTGRANPNVILIHPTDWQNVRLTRTAAGEYIMGAPAQAGETRLFGLPVAITDVLTAGTAIVGDFTGYSYIGERRGIDIQIGYSGTQFVEGKKTIRGDLRAVFTVTRPSAFATVTGL